MTRFFLPALLLLTVQIAHSQLPAFPGAEGFGAYATGGRGGDVYTVTNLNSAGAGSLREGIESAPSAGRTIVFAVSGYIHVPGSNLRIVPNNITIAGQTAPGDGIGLRDGTVRLESDALFKHLDSLGALSVEIAASPDDCARLWELRREFSYSLRATGLTKLNEGVIVPRSRLVDLVDFAESLQKTSGFPVACFGRAGDGNIHVNIMVPDMKDPEQKTRADEALNKLFHQVIAWGGAITGEHGIGIARQPWFKDTLHPGAQHTHLLLKNALDPNHILNPGKFISP